MWQIFSWWKERGWIPKSRDVHRGFCCRLRHKYHLQRGRGTTLRTEGANPAVVGSAGGPQCWQAGRGKGRRGGHVCRSNCWKRARETSPLSQQRRFLIFNKMPTPWWGQAALSAHHRSISIRHCAPLPAGWDPQGPSIPRGTRHAPADGNHQHHPTPG